MARKPRLHVPGALYHVILRGNARQDIFFDDEDRQVFYALLEEGTRRFGFRVHAFCLMSNHAHLALQTAQSPLSRALQNLAFRYTRHINRKHGRVGHLFQGRYKALLVDAQSYLLELTRYIHLNPVRARLVTDPAQYPDSGHLGYLGKRHFGFLTTEWVLSQFDERVGIARRRYANFVAQGIEEGHRAEFYRGAEEGRVLGSDQFVERVLRAAGETQRRRAPALGAIVAYVCKRLDLKEGELAKPGKQRQAAHARALIGWLARSCGSAPLVEVARRFGRDLSSVSRAVSAMERVAATNGAQARELLRQKKAILQA